jgi:hypothetical protein
MKALGDGVNETDVELFTFPTAFATKGASEKTRSISHTTAEFWSCRRIQCLKAVSPTRTPVG